MTKRTLLKKISGFVIWLSFILALLEGLWNSGPQPEQAQFYTTPLSYNPCNSLKRGKLISDPTFVFFECVFSCRMIYFNYSGKGVDQSVLAPGNMFLTTIFRAVGSSYFTG